MIRPIDLDLESVVPGLRVVCRVDEVTEAVPVQVEVRRGEADATGAIRVKADIGPVEGQLVHAADASIGNGDRIVPDYAPDPDVPLARLRHLGVLVDQPGLRDSLRVREVVQSCLVGGQVRVLPEYLSRARRGRAGRGEVNSERRMSQLEGLIDRDVEQRAVVVDAETPEDRGFVILVERVREPNARLERAVERFAAVARADVPVEVERGRQRVVVAGERVDHRLRRHVVIVHHPRLEIPPDAEVDREPWCGAPVVLQIGADLIVALVEQRIAGAILELVGVSEIVGHAAHGVAIREPWRLVVALQHVVLHEIEARAHLEHVLAAGLVGEVVAEAQALLDEVLATQVAADGVVRVVVRIHARGNARLIRAWIPPEARIVHLGFVEPRTRIAVVFQLSDRHVLAEIDGLLEGVDAKRTT